jgi:glycosyltransferase involved in cell wall biosynthesis
MVVPLVATGRQTDHFTVVQAAVERLNLTDQVTWMGFLTPLELQAVVLGARAMVVPTLFEAASGPLWEAFTAGVPAACSNVTSLPEQAGDAAVLFDPYDVTAMAGAIAAVWSDDGLRRRLVAAGRSRVAALSWERTARLFRAHYRRLAGAPLAPEESDELGEVR